MPKARSSFWDLTKFVAIALVVFGHVQGAAGMTAGQPFVENFIVNMNMPLFFLISGYFSYGLVKGGDWKKFGWRLIGYFWPLMMVSVVLNTIELSFGLPDYKDFFLKEVLKGFLFCGWYLYVLAICVSIVFVSLRIKAGLKIRLCAIVMAFVASLFIRHAWYLPYFRHMFPFFLIGLGCKHMKIDIELKLTWKIGLSALLLFCLTAFWEGDVYRNFLIFYRVDSSWWGLTANWQAPLWELAHYALGILGSVGVMWAIAAFLKVAPIVGKLAPLGETTLGVYLLHQWLLKRVVDQGWLSSSVWVVLMWTVILFVGCHYLTRLSTRGVWCNRIFWGKLK